MSVIDEAGRCARCREVFSYGTVCVAGPKATLRIHVVECLCGSKVVKTENLQTVVAPSEGEQLLIGG